MTELEKIAYAKSFMDKLANGINPLDDTPIPDADIVNNVRLSRCFFYVSDILRQVYENGGVTKPKRAPKKPFSIKNMFSKLTITAPQNNVGAYPTAYIANAILGDAHYFALKDDPTAIGYNFENVFGCVTQINAETNEETTLTTLYDLPEGPNFSQLNCQGCESLPENHNLDKEIWDISDLSNPKLR